MSAFEQSRHLKTPQAPPNHRQHMGCESTFNGGTISTKNAAKSKSQSIFGGPESRVQLNRQGSVSIEDNPKKIVGSTR
jgi:hypothetical protein